MNARQPPPPSKAAAFSSIQGSSLLLHPRQQPPPCMSGLARPSRDPFTHPPVRLGPAVAVPPPFPCHPPPALCRLWAGSVPSPLIPSLCRESAQCRGAALRAAAWRRALLRIRVSLSRKQQGSMPRAPSKAQHSRMCPAGGPAINCREARAAAAQGNPASPWPSCQASSPCPVGRAPSTAHPSRAPQQQPQQLMDPLAIS